MVATKLYVDGGGGQVVIRWQCDAVLKMSLLAEHQKLRLTASEAAYWRCIRIFFRMHENATS